MTTMTRGRESVRSQFAEQLHLMRRRAGITQAALATAMGVSRATVSAWETGAALPHLEMVERLGDYLRTITGDETIEFRFNASRRSA